MYRHHQHRGATVCPSARVCIWSLCERKTRAGKRVISHPKTSVNMVTSTRHYMSERFRNVTEILQRDSAFGCPCCRFKTLRGHGHDEICKVCFWEDDSQDDHDANEVRGGPNGTLSLSKARDNFASFRAADRRFCEKVRPPLPSGLWRIGLCSCEIAWSHSRQSRQAPVVAITRWRGAENWTVPRPTAAHRGTSIAAPKRPLQCCARHAIP
jgi:hypothetical protein